MSAEQTTEHVVDITTTTHLGVRYTMTASCTCGWSDSRSWLWPKDLAEVQAEFEAHAEQT